MKTHLFRLSFAFVRRQGSGTVRPRRLRAVPALGARSSRGNAPPLVDYTMRPDRDPLAVTMSEPVFFSRESATGGRGIGGSGCGCN